MTPAALAFTMETTELTGAAASACLAACLAAGTVAIVHVTSRHRPRGRGWLTIGTLTIATVALFFLAFEFWRLP